MNTENFDCPICGGIVVLKHEPMESIMYKVDKDIIDSYYYECNTCGEQWTVNEDEKK